MTQKAWREARYGEKKTNAVGLGCCGTGASLAKRKSSDLDPRAFRMDDLLFVLPLLLRRLDDPGKAVLSGYRRLGDVVLSGLFHHCRGVYPVDRFSALAWRSAIGAEHGTGRGGLHRIGL